MEFYWELIQHDGTRLEIPPAGVDVIKRRMASGEPINTRTSVIPVNQIKHFRQTDRPFGTTPLLEAAAQAFDEPLLTEDGSVKAKWCKRSVTQERWNRHYAAIPSYRKIGEDGAMIIMAWRQPIHKIDLARMSECSQEESDKLNS